MKNAKQHRGQVALVLVLIMTVVSALAVTLASRSTVDTRIQQTESQSVQALVNAQNGLEQLILNPGSNGVNTPTYIANKTDIGMEAFTVGRVDEGSSVELNLAGADFTTLTGFSVYWSPDADNPGGQPAVLITTISNTGVVKDYAYDYLGNNGFSVALDGSSQGYEKKTPKIALSSSTARVRITVLGKPVLMKILPLDSGALFPSQVKSIQSVGSVASDQNAVKYGLQYDESSADSVPSVFDYALFSGGSIIQ